MCAVTQQKAQRSEYDGGKNALLSPLEGKESMKDVKLSRRNLAGQQAQ